MAAIDYDAIKNAIRDAILGDATLGEPGRNVTVEIEPGNLDSVERTPWIAIYLDSEESPDSMQKLRNGTSLDSKIRFVLGVVEHSLEGMPQATKLRDEIVSRLSIVLLKNHQLTDVNEVRVMYQTGVEYENARTESSCIAVAAISVTCEVQATT